MRLIPEQVKAPAFTPGGRESVELRIKRIVHHWVLILSFDWAVAGGTGAGAFFTDAQARLVKEWVLNGNGKKLVQMGGGALYLYTLLFLREMYTQTLPTALAAATDEDGRELRVYLPAAMGHALPGQEETFGLPPVESPSMEFLYGEAADLVDADGDGAYSFSNEAARLVEWAYDNPRIPEVIQNGQRRQVGFSAFRARTQSKPVNGDGEELLFTFPELEQGFELRALIIETLSGGQAGGVDYEYDSGVVTDIMEFEVNGEEKYKPITFRDAQQENKRDYALADLVTGAAVIDAAADQNIGRGELWQHRVRTQPFLKLRASKQGADLNQVRVTSIFTAR